MKDTRIYLFGDVDLMLFPMEWGNVLSILQMLTIQVHLVMLSNSVSLLLLHSVTKVCIIRLYPLKRGPTMTTE